MPHPCFTRAIRTLRALAVAAFACAGSAQAQDAPRIVAVNAPLQSFAEYLLDGAGTVSLPVPEGVDPAFWRPDADAVGRIQSADLILLNGAGFARWVGQVSLPRARIVDTSAAFRDRYIVADTVTHSHGDGGNHTHAALASHVWLDPTLALAQAEAIAAALAARGLADPGTIYANFAALRSAIEAADANAAAALAPAQGLPMLASHPRYQYLAARYGLTIDALDWEAGAAPSAAQIDALETRVAETGARILIWEAAPPQQARDAVAALGLVSVVFDTMAGGIDDSYVADFTASVTALAEAADRALRE